MLHDCLMNQVLAKLDKTPDFQGNQALEPTIFISKPGVSALNSLLPPDLVVSPTWVTGTPPE